jgi:hypothetical protein
VIVVGVAAETTKVRPLTSVMPPTRSTSTQSPMLYGWVANDTTVKVAPRPTPVVEACGTGLPGKAE